MQLSLKQTTFLVIELDYEYSFFDSFQKAVNFCPDCNIISINFYDTYITGGGNEQKLYKIQFLDSREKFKIISMRNWKITDIYKGEFGRSERNSWGVTNGFRIEDPKGVVKVKYFPMYIGHTEDLLAPIQCLKLFNVISKYGSWVDYEIRIEYEKLIEENRKLKNEIKELRKRIDE